jgi:predicted outer membrane repeat protein
MKKLISVFICLLLAVPSQARTITVDDNGPADFNNIQAAVNDSNSGDTIEVQPGLYTGAGNRDIDLSDKSITVRSTDPNDPNIVAATIIDCNGTAMEPHRGFYCLNSVSTSLVTAGFTIINGYHDDGGGMYLNVASSPSNLTIRNCVISGSTAEWRGGGIYFGSLAPVGIIDGCKFSNNTAELGGGICCRGYLTISNCTIFDNTCTGSGLVGGGGGIASYTCDSIITNCTITDNNAIQGGGVCCVKCLGPVRINNCILWDNEGYEIFLQWFPGAMGRTTVSYCDVEGGSASVGGELSKLIWGSGNIDEDPDFVNPDPDGPDYHLLPISPCINAGDPALAVDPDEKDIDGQPRVLYGRVDIGVDEVYPIAGDFEPDEDIDLVDFAFFAMHWLETGCGTCGGADFTGNGNVNFYDLKELTDEWLAGL